MRALAWLIVHGFGVAACGGGGGDDPDAGRGELDAAPAPDADLAQGVLVTVPVAGLYKDVFYRDGDGAWMPAREADLRGQLWEFDVYSARYAVMTACRPPGGPLELHVAYALTGEEVALRCNTPVGPMAPRTREVDVTIAGGPTGPGTSASVAVESATGVATFSAGLDTDPAHVTGDAYDDTGTATVVLAVDADDDRRIDNLAIRRDLTEGDIVIGFDLATDIVPLQARAVAISGLEGTSAAYVGSQLRMGLAHGAPATLLSWPLVAGLGTIELPAASGIAAGERAEIVAWHEQSEILSDAYGQRVQVSVDVTASSVVSLALPPIPTGVEADLVPTATGERCAVRFHLDGADYYRVRCLTGIHYEAFATRRAVPGAGSDHVELALPDVSELVASGAIDPAFAHVPITSVLTVRVERLEGDPFGSVAPSSAGFYLRYSATP
jgi:hypothetical protein